MGSELVGKGNISVRTQAKILSIYPDFAVLIYAVKFKQNSLVPIHLGQLESLPVPPHTGRQIAAWPARWFLLAIGPFDAPVVWKIDVSPASIFKARPLCAWRVSLQEFPPKIKAVPGSLDEFA
jgi:hypothetical protein